MALFLLHAMLLAAPGTILIQGKLADSSGKPLPGARRWRVQFYDAATAGNALGSALTGTITLAATGRFTLEITPPAAVLAAAGSIFYEIAIDSASTPDGSIGASDVFPTRVKISSALWAQNALNTVNADKLDGLHSRNLVTTPTLASGLAAKADLAHGHQLQNLSGAVIDAQVPDTITVLQANRATSATHTDLLDGRHGADFAGAAHAHDLDDLNGQVTDDQVPDTITILRAADADRATTAILALRALAADQATSAAYADRATTATYALNVQANGSVDGAAIIDGTVSNSKIAGVAYGKISGAPASLPPSGAAGGSLTGTYPNPNIANGAVGAAQIGVGVVGQFHIASGAVNASHIANGAVGTAQILDGSVIQADLANAAVTNSKIADGSVSNAKISDMAYSKLTGAPTSLPPSGAAGGSLAGTYPNPGLANDSATSLTLADRAVVDAKVRDVAWSKLTGVPTSMPPSGAAGGALTGTYPNPTIAAGAVGTAQIVDGSLTAADIAAGSVGSAQILDGSVIQIDLANSAVTNAKLADGSVNNNKITDVAYSKLIGAPTSLPPSGAAGGSLTGTYPNPSIANLAVTDAKIADVAWSKITGEPTSFPPNGAAGGDLTGTYPNPTIAANAVANTELASDIASLNKVSAGLLGATGSSTAGTVRVTSTTAVEFGYGAAGKESQAGKIAYAKWSDDLDIVGAGTTAANRAVTLWAEGGTTLKGPLLMNGTAIDTVSTQTLMLKANNRERLTFNTNGSFQFVMGEAGQEVEDQIQTFGNSYFILNSYFGQSFTAGISGQLTKIHFRCGNPGSANQFTIRQGSGLAGTVLYQANVAPTLVSGEWYVHVLSTPLTVAAGQQYTFQVNSSAANMSLYGANYSSYTGGAFFISGNTYSNYHIAFKTVVVPTRRLIMAGLGGRVGIGRDPEYNTLEVEGNVSKTTAGDWLANSDRRLKTDITPLTGSLAAIMNLTPVKYHYTPEYKAQHPSVKDQFYYNFVAQDYQKVFPEAVVTDARGFLMIDTHPAEIVTIGAVQELNQQLKETRAENDALKSQLKSLNARLEALEGRRQ